MGVGYAASPLHRIIYLDPIEGAQAEPPPSNPIITSLLKRGGVWWDGRPREYRSPSITDIVRWRDEVGEKYKSQLGEELLWDEDSAFQQYEDVGTGADMFLRYTAAVLDQHGPAGSRFLIGMKKPPHSILDATFFEAERKGFAGRFPQVLLGAKYWFPFNRHLIIEEPNWRGDIERYGSLYQLRNEVDEIRAFVAELDPKATIWTAEKATPDDILPAAWQASDTLSRLCASAVAQNLPLWTTG